MWVSAYTWLALCLLSSPPVAGVWWACTWLSLCLSLLSTCSWCVVSAYTWLSLWLSPLSLSTSPVLVCGERITWLALWLSLSLSSTAGVWWAHTLDWLYDSLSSPPVAVCGESIHLIVSMPLCFAIALIDFLFSFSIQIACFSLKVLAPVFILVCVSSSNADSECRSNGYNWYGIFPAFNIWRINATGHSWSLRKTREATDPILLLTSDRGELLKCCSFYLVKHYVLKWQIINVTICSFSYIHLLIIFANVLTPQPTEHFVFTVSYLWRALYIWLLN